MVVAAALAATGVGFVIGLSRPIPFFKEGGAIELATAAALFALSAGMMLLVVQGRPDTRFWHLPVLLFLMGGREMDWDKSLLSNGMLKSRFYLGDAPIWEKAIGLAVVMLLLYCTIRTIRLGAGPALRALRRGAAWPLAFAAGVALVMGAKAIDGIDRKLSPWGIAIPDDLVSLAGKVEEVMELAFVLSIILALGLWSRRLDAGPSCRR